MTRQTEAYEVLRRDYGIGNIIHDNAPNAPPGHSQSVIDFMAGRGSQQ